MRTPARKKAVRKKKAVRLPRRKISVDRELEKKKSRIIRIATTTHARLVDRCANLDGSHSHSELAIISMNHAFALAAEFDGIDDWIEQKNWPMPKNLGELMEEDNQTEGEQ